MLCKKEFTMSLLLVVSKAILEVSETLKNYAINL